MRTDFTGTPGTDWQLERGPHAFSGPPDECTGILPIRNLSARTVRLRRLKTTRPTRVRQGFSALEKSHVRLRVNLPPESEVRAEARLELPEQTPPGRYLGHLKAGDDKATLEVNVEATRLLELDPEELLLAGNAGEDVAFTISVRNAGNTPIELKRIAPVWLIEQDWNERLLFSVLRDSDDHDDFATFAQRLLDRARQEVPAPARLTSVPAPELTLDPGHRIDLQLSLTLPDNLRPGHEYTGFIRINEERVDLDVYCEGPATQRPPSEPASESHEP